MTMTDSTKTDTVKITSMGPSVNAGEWALRHGMEIAQRHASGFEAQAALAKDIAEALQRQADLMGQVGKLFGGRGVSGEK